MILTPASSLSLSWRMVELASSTQYSLAAGCTTPTQTSTEAARPVKTMAVTTGGEPDLHSFPRKVEASTRVGLAFHVPVLLVKLPVKEGQKLTNAPTVPGIKTWRS